MSSVQSEGTRDTINSAERPVTDRRLAEIMPEFFSTNGSGFYRLINSQAFGSTGSRAIPTTVDQQISLSKNYGPEPDPNRVLPEAREIIDPYCALLKAVNDGRELDDAALLRLRNLTVTWIMIGNNGRNPGYMVRVAFQQDPPKGLFARRRKAAVDEVFVNFTNTPIPESRSLELKDTLRRDAESIKRGEYTYPTAGFTLANDNIRRSSFSDALRWDEYCANANTRNSEKVHEIEGQVDIAIGELSTLMGVNQSGLSEKGRALIANIKKELIAQVLEYTRTGRERQVKRLIESYKDRLFEALGGNWANFNPGINIGYDNTSKLGMYNGKLVLLSLPSSYGAQGLERATLDKVRSVLLSQDLNDLTLQGRLSHILKAAFEQGVITRASYPELYNILYPQTQQRAQQQRPGGFGFGSSFGSFYDSLFGSFPGAGTAGQRGYEQAWQSSEDIRAKIERQLNYYKDLGVSSSASLDEIKKAFRRLARQYHPDVHGNRDNKAAEQRFKEINEAYEILGDAPRRAQYDIWRRYPQAEFKYDSKIK